LILAVVTASLLLRVFAVVVVAPAVKPCGKQLENHFACWEACLVFPLEDAMMQK